MAHALRVPSLGLSGLGTAVRVDARFLSDFADSSAHIPQQRLGSGAAPVVCGNHDVQLIEGTPRAEQRLGHLDAQ
eukprot:9133854-Pyramimonas_sp.AAC.1